MAAEEVGIMGQSREGVLQEVLFDCLGCELYIQQEAAEGKETYGTW